MTRFIKLLMLLLACNCSVAANAEDITVMISGGFSAALDKLAPHYEAQTGDVIHIIHGPSMGNSPESIPHRLAAGQKADVVIMVGYALDKLQQAGKITPGSRTELADSRIGMVVRSGTAVPDISNVAALKAKSVAYSDSASGRYVQSELFRKLGIENELHNKLDMIEKTPVARVVASSGDEIGFQQVSELLPVKGVEFVGKIPEQVQYVTRFSGAIVAGSVHQEHARQLLRYLASPEMQPVVCATGLDSLDIKAGTIR
ncbi:ABC transporter substrate-binding protein [Salmonella enterica]|nr:ABC transporter substrate-binding protein [Salmonella enterica]EAX3609336.1 ABC transporter substrate-binding protein [Salmonella enterica]EGW6282880.1 ABC transporter substrate-binding protein [Salmonella enterica]EGX3935292.1 ABC transporter substrate-binding protein [Salmonella enterica]